MNILVYVVLPVIGSFFLMGCLFYGMEQIADTTGKSRKMKLLIYFFYSVLVIFLSLFHNSLINVLTLVAIPFIGGWVNQTGKLQLIYNFCLVVAVYLLDAFLSVGWPYFMGSSFMYLNSSQLYLAAFIVVLRFGEFLVSRFVVFLIRRHEGSQITGKQLAVSMILPVFSVVNMLSLIVCMQVYLTEEMVVVFLVNMGLLIGINLFFSVLVDTMGVNYKLEKELELSRQQSRLQVEYYEREEKKYEESRKLIHDIRNHIQTMESLYQTEGKAEAEVYAGDIHGMLNDLGQTYYTSVKLLNIILNDKAAAMKQAGIRGDIKTGDLDLSFMKDTEITTIFANILDNAIDGVKGASSPYIRLRVKNVNSFLSIVMENSADKEPVRKKNRLVSGKPGHEGLGLKNVERVVEQYGGDLELDWKEGVFYTKIMLNIPDATKVEQK